MNAAVDKAFGSVRVAYLISQYPKLSHSFIQTEIAALRSLGAEVAAFTVRSADESDLGTMAAQRSASETVVLQQRSASRLARACASLLRRRPSALMHLLATALKSGAPGLRPRLWQCFYALEAIILWRELERRGIHHVHVHFANNAADIARLVVTLGRAVTPGEPWFWSLSMHGPTEFEDVSRFDLPAKLTSASAVACITDYCRSQAMRLTAPEHWHKLQVVRMGVDVELFAARTSPVAETLGRPIRILSVGRLVPEKGASVLLEAVHRIDQSGLDFRLTIVGGGPDADLLSGVASRLGVADKVHLLGPVDQESLPEVYADADIFCLPSFAEGLPVVLMEAMACELPVVATRIAGVPELVIPGATGVLVPPGRSDVLAEALADLARDPFQRAEYGSNGRAAVIVRHDPGGNAGTLLTMLAAVQEGSTNGFPRRPAEDEDI